MESKSEIETISRKKTLSIVGFLVSIALLLFAIFLSINQENAEKIATIETKTEEQNLVEIVSSDLGKNINEVKQEQNIAQVNENIINEQTNNVIEKKVYTNEPTETEKELFSNDSIKEAATEPIDIKAEDKKNETEEQSNAQFIKPVEGEVIRPFSMDRLVYSETLQEWVTHRGIDIKADKLKEVKASASGKIKSIKTDPRYGLSVTIEHNDGFETIYSCLISTDEVEEGQDISQGDTIGKIGNSGVFEVSDGTHLHFEMLKNGEYVNPDLYIK